MKRWSAAITIILCLLVFAAPAGGSHWIKSPRITHSVSGACTVTQTLALDRVANRKTVSFEFLPGEAGLGEASWASSPVTSRTQTFSLTRSFTAAENGRWVAHAELFYSMGRPAYESYLDVMVAC